jgi:hypothetical protein
MGSRGLFFPQRNHKTAHTHISLCANKQTQNQHQSAPHTLARGIGAERAKEIPNHIIFEQGIALAETHTWSPLGYMFWMGESVSSVLLFGSCFCLFRRSRSYKSPVILFQSSLGSQHRGASRLQFGFLLVDSIHRSVRGTSSPRLVLRNQTYSRASFSNLVIYSLPAS